MKGRGVTITAKANKGVGYYLEDGVYHLMDFRNGVLLESMNEVAFMFDYNDCRDGAGPTLLLHGNPNYVIPNTTKLRNLYIENGQANIAAHLVAIQGKIPIDEIDKMLCKSGYVYKDVLKNEG